MKETEIAIKIDSLSKEYRLGQLNSGTLTSDLQSWWANLRGKEDPNTIIGKTVHLHNERFFALNNISLNVYKGDTLGIIGGNGAGKSTLLKLLSKITTPSDGTIKYNGKISSMLEVGTGFSAEMTGRDNIFMNGAILGMSKAEIESKLDQIIEFSECGEFIDTPVKRYSSGMYVKLAFAVAAHLSSEILIMDEVLAVGDMQFQNKCIKKMKSLAHDEKRTVLYVSHNMSTIRELCNRCIVLNKGEIIFDGDTESAIQVYMNNDYSSCTAINYDLTSDQSRSRPPRGAKLLNIRFTDKSVSYFESGEKIKLLVSWIAFAEVKDVTLILDIYYIDGSIVTLPTVTLGNAHAGEQLESLIEVDTSNFAGGKYFFNPELQSSNSYYSSDYFDVVTDNIHFEIGQHLLNEPSWNHAIHGHYIPIQLKMLENKIENKY